MPATNTRPMSGNTVRSALRRLGYGNDDMTAHGFRAVARIAAAFGALGDAKKYVGEPDSSLAQATLTRHRHHQPRCRLIRPHHLPSPTCRG